MKKYGYEVYESNAGLFLFVFDTETGEAVYGHYGYECDSGGKLSDDLDALEAGADPIADDWDQNQIDEMSEMLAVLENNNLADLIAIGFCPVAGYYPQDGYTAGIIYADCMELYAQEEFGVPEGYGGAEPIPRINTWKAPEEEVVAWMIKYGLCEP